jgi:hypothetical protein
MLAVQCRRKKLDHTIPLKIRGVLQEDCRSKPSCFWVRRVMAVCCRIKAELDAPV